MPRLKTQADLIRLRALYDRDLDLSGFNLKGLPGEIQSNVKIINANNNRIKKLPAWIKRLKKLGELSLRNNNLTILPKELAELRRTLTSIDIAENNFETVPPVLTKMRKLQQLSLAGNKFNELPDTFRQLKDLEYLDLSNNSFQTFPKVLGELSDLTYLNMGNNPELKEIPSDIAEWINFPNLILDISGNPRITRLPPTIGGIRGLQTDNPEIEELFKRIRGLEGIGRRTREASRRNYINLGFMAEERPEWMEYCRSLNQEYGINELRSITSELGLSVRDSAGKMMTKRALCVQLAQDFESYQGFEEAGEESQKRGCTNDPLVADADSFDELPDEIVIEWTQDGKKWCLSLEALQGMKKTNNNLNPYTRTPLPDAVWEAYETQLKSMRTLNDPKKDQKRIHSSAPPSVSSTPDTILMRDELRKLFGKINDAYPYLPEGYIRDMKQGELDEFYRFFLELGPGYRNALDEPKFYTKLRESEMDGLYELLTQLHEVVNRNDDIDFRIIGNAMDQFVQIKMGQD